MRLRTIKPGFFKNEDLAALPPLARLLYAGLWCMADREGRLEDRPKRIKVELLPYDSADVNKLLDALAQADFIVRYSSGAERYIEIPAFLLHQNPHVKEAISRIPARCDASPVQAPCEPSASPVLSGQVLSCDLSLGSCLGSGSSPSPAGPVTAEVMTPTKQFIHGWGSLFQRCRSGAQYAFEGAKDGAHVKAILGLAGGDVAEALRRAEVHLTDPFWAERGANLGTLKSQWNRCVHGAGNGSGIKDPLAGVKAFAARLENLHEP